MATERTQAEARVEEGYVASERDRVLLYLIKNDVINVGELRKIEDISNPNDSAEIILGYAVGLFQKTPRHVAAAMEGSGISVNPKDIEERGWPISERFEEVEEGMDIWREAIEYVGGLMLIPVERLIEMPGDYPSEEEKATRKIEEDKALALVDEMEGDALNETEAKEIRELIYLHKHQEAFDALHRAGTEEERARLETDLGRGRTIHVPMDQQARSELAHYVRLNQQGVRPTDQLAPVTGPGLRGVPSGENPLYPSEYALSDSFGALGEAGREASFQAHLVAEGITGPDDVEPPEGLPRATYFGDGVVIDPSSYDPATGGARQFSDEEWELVHTDPIARAKYAASKITTPAVQAIIANPHFAGQVDQTRVINFVNADGEWDTKTISTGSVSGINPGASVTQIPIEDIGITTPVKGFRNPDGSWNSGNPWERQVPKFEAGAGRAQWVAMTPRSRRINMDVMANEGLIEDYQWDAAGGVDGGIRATGGFNLMAMGIWEQAVGLASDMGWTPQYALREIGEFNRMQQPRPPRSYGGGASAPKYSVPASLRTIPDYKALAQESKGIFRQEVGRDLEDWELAILADELGTEYTNRNDQMIVAHKAAWDDAVAGGSTEVDYSEVTEPSSALQYDIEERYANELDRQERVEDRALNRRVLMDSITTGRRMI